MDKSLMIKELKELKDKVKQEKLEETDYAKIVEMFSNLEEQEEVAEEKGKENVVQFVKSNPKYPSLLDKRAGFTNVIYLATMSLVFEVLFLAISFMIFK